MKLISKDKLVMKQGRIVEVETNEIIGVPNEVHLLAAKLETAIQQADYLDQQAPFSPVPTLDGFKRKSIKDKGKWRIEPKPTPVHDQLAEQAEAFMDEADDMQRAGDLQHAVDGYAPLLEWLDAEEVPVAQHYNINVIDTPVLGDLLDLTSEQVIAHLERLVDGGVHIDLEDGDMGPRTKSMFWDKFDEWSKNHKAQPKVVCSGGDPMTRFAGAGMNHITGHWADKED